MCSVREITWIGAIKWALDQVKVDTCASDTWSLG